MAAVFDLDLRLLTLLNITDTNTAGVGIGTGIGTGSGMGPPKGTGPASPPLSGSNTALPTSTGPGGSDNTDNSGSNSTVSSGGNSSSNTTITGKYEEWTSTAIDLMITLNEKRITVAQIAIDVDISATSGIYAVPQAPWLTCTGESFYVSALLPSPAHVTLLNAKCHSARLVQIHFKQWIHRLH